MGGFVAAIHAISHRTLVVPSRYPVIGALGKIGQVVDILPLQLSDTAANMFLLSLYLSPHSALLELTAREISRTIRFRQVAEGTQIGVTEFPAAKLECIVPTCEVEYF